MKFKYLLSIVLVFALCFGVLNLAFADQTEPVPEGYTPIYSAQDLNNIRNDLAGKYILMNDIDLSVYENWEPIGTSEVPFTGEFDGNGKLILNLTINENCTESGFCNFGLFGYAKNSTIKNCNVTKANINVKFEGTETAKCRLGAVVGFGNSVTLTNCSASGNLMVKDFSSTDVGGIIGRSSGVSWLTLCANYSNISASIISSANWIYAGGVSGVSLAVENKCCNLGNVSVSGNGVNSSCTVKIGGIDGKGFECKLKDCYNKGNISLDFYTNETYVGGISGDSYIIENAYSNAEITLPENFTGYSGAISGSIGLDGYAFISDFPYVNNVYYSKTDLPVGYAAGVHPDEVAEDSFSITYKNFAELSDSEMIKQESYSGFDFETVWEMEENGYPILQNQPKLTDDITEKPTEESTTEPTTEPETESTTNPTTEPETTNPAEDDIPYIIRVLMFIWNYIKSFVLNAFKLITMILQ